MGVLDFLFEGSPPPPSTTTSTTALPAWMQEYTTQLLSRANQEAASGYQSYGGARIAGFTPTQMAAFDMARGNVGSAQPGLNAAMQIGQNLPGQGALQQAMSYLPGAMEDFPDAADRYMNPYTENVTNRARDLALRSWEEDIQPGLEGQFVRSGNFGSSAHARALGQAARDVTQNIQDTAGASLAQGWNDSANIFGADQSRRGTLASIAGQLGATQGNLGISQAGLLGDLAQTLQRTNANDAATLESIGSQEQQLGQRNLDLAYGDFESQRDYNRDQINWLQNLLTGTAPNVPQSTVETGPAGSYQPSGLAQIAAMINAWRGMGGGGDEE